MRLQCYKMRILVLAKLLMIYRPNLMLAINACVNEKRIDDNEQRNRNQCLLFHGIEESDGEITDDLVLQVLRRKLELPVLTVDHIQRSHRLGSKRVPGKARLTRSNLVKPRPIIVRFQNYRDRQMIFKTKRKLKNQGVSLGRNLATTCTKLPLQNSVEATVGQLKAELWPKLAMI